ncbi:Putative beta-lactamase-inhibitor-like, PepSY-like [Chryseobacterium rhizoplanae]|uniref:Beta-lactamase-inhibitor-like, PepSY-like n=1 Tax=Chryseobacterium rhizoplanae TaxID=1609531 RepID=A0A521AQZ8_9FLAO|nr:PepSY-like domain-containing protein [Chryseobacterium rhizoplanae]SMO37237.1 Putative beta-lactamase-inhibitor-like, PepSY-like [Chryseobacterium rhizoplanae]
MKKVAILLTMITAVVFVNAQKVQQKNVPGPVLKGFQKQFPTVKDAKWEKEDGNYEAGFTINGTEASVVINPSGSILETETEMSSNSLSTSIKAYIVKNYPNQKIKEAAKITDSEGIVTYEAEVNGKDLIFDNKGKFLKEKKD